jgi:hypothetical protein
MSVISGEHIEFVSATPIFSKVKRFLKSYAGTNMLDEGEFPTYLYEVLSTIGINVMDESEAIIPINNYKGCLPNDFVQLYCAYKCKPTLSTKGEQQLQNVSSVYYELSKECYLAEKNCQLNCDATDPLCKWTMTTYVNELPITHHLENPTLLRLSPNVKEKSSKDCLNLLHSSPYEMRFSGRDILVNFTDDCVYMKYYSIPVDEDNIPLVPDIIQLHKAIEWYIIYQISLSWWMNNEAPDIQSKWQKAEQEYYDALGGIRHNRKLPSFSRLINYIRNKRKYNMVSVFSSSDKFR